MNFPNPRPLYCMPRSKMMRISCTLRGRLQYILAKGLLQKKMNDNEMKAHESKIRALL